MMSRATYVSLADDPAVMLPSTLEHFTVLLVNEVLAALYLHATILTSDETDHSYEIYAVYASSLLYCVAGIYSILLFKVGGACWCWIPMLALSSSSYSPWQADPSANDD